MTIHVIGAGLAGSEAAWQLAERGWQVQLWEMRPAVLTAAHKSGACAELVCSNSLGSQLITSAGGLLKAELETLGSMLVAAAKATAVPAGGALAVDRQQFAAAVTTKLQNHRNITMVREECRQLPAAGTVLLATGPLTSFAMTVELQRLAQAEHLYFYDAAAPIIDADTVDYEKGFWGARYDKGTPDYFNCPLNQQEYETFYDALLAADVVPLREGIEDLKVFEACMPVEVMARRGRDTLRFGPLRPVGLKDSQGRRPYAVLQLRKENIEGSLLNLVGFQTRLKWPEQRRVVRLIPALARAEFHRYGVMHRNTFLNSPRALNYAFQFQSRPRIFAAGQLTGVEGYMESTASGLMAALQIDRMLRGREFIQFPAVTMLGALAKHVSDDVKDFQPMGANFGILPPLEPPVRDKKRRKEAYSLRSLNDLSRLTNLLEN